MTQNTCRDSVGVLWVDQGWERSLDDPADVDFGDEWVEDISIQDAMSRRAALSLAAIHAETMSMTLHALGQWVSSPPEKAFLLAFIVRAAKSFGEPCVAITYCPDHSKRRDRWGPEGFGGSGAYVICPQHQLDGYRVDFFIEAPLHDGAAVAIEIDGHDFHEKTKEQVARDKKRERVIVSSGVNVLRFSGSEVFRGANNCATEVMGYLGGMAARLRESQ